MNRAATPALFVASGVSQYLGAAIGIGLFALIPPMGVAWWRIALGGILLLGLWRPWRMEWTWRKFGAAVLFGCFVGLMNILFYEAIARLPLGAAVSLEFVGPVAVALIAGTGLRTRLAAVLAFVGVVAIGGFGVDIASVSVRWGVALALAAAVMWAGYIVVGQKVAASGMGVASLAVGCASFAVMSVPVVLIGSESIGPVTWPALWALLGVAVLSTVIPYSVEAVALKRLSASAFALLTALLPATSTVVAFFTLSQKVTWGEALGLILISLAVWMATAPARSDKVYAFAEDRPRD